MPSLSIFHPGEQLVQERVGVREHVKATGLESFIRRAMPDQHRLFFQQQQLLYLSSRDGAGRPWATVLAGRPGFLTSPDPQHLTVQHLRLPPEDPLVGSLVPGAEVGMLGLELHTRRRNRLNGVIASVSTPGARAAGSHTADASAPHGADLQVVIDVSLSFGNCPKYIQGRRLDIDWEALDQAAGAGTAGAGGADATDAGQRATRGGALLGQEQRRIVRQADTFFIASCYDGPAPAGTTGASIGCDMSHRGGPTGFLQLAEQGGGTVLRWAEYQGNNMFQTLGNLMLNPKAGLLILDFDTGDTLHMTGEAFVDYDDRSLPGALRTVSFHLHSFVHVRHALPLRHVSAVDWSPFLPAPASQADDDSTQQGAAGGSRTDSPSIGNTKPTSWTVECVSVVAESHDVKTFEFRLPAGLDRHAAYRPGQFATFEFPAAAFRSSTSPAADASALVRTWTVSSHPSWTARSGTFTISVKRVGVISSYLHDSMRPGSTVTLRAFGGDFTPSLLPPASASAGGAVLLLAGGIGITPLRAMMHDFLLQASASQQAAGNVADGAPAAASATTTSTAPGDLSSAKGILIAGATQVAAQAVPIERLVLFYSIKGVQDAAFVKELSAAAEAANVAAAGCGSSFRVQLVVTVSQLQGGAEALQAARSLWPGIEVYAGRITAQLLLQYACAQPVTGLSGSVRAAFMCGPAAFMAAAEQLLTGAGLDGARLFSESFSF